MKFLFESYQNKYSLSTRLLLMLLTLPSLVLAQAQKDKPNVTFEELYDEPYSINKLFIGFQPLYGEVFATNVNAGFGLEASYFQKDKFDLKAHFRKTYSSEFFDYNRNASIKNQDNYTGTIGGFTDKPQVYNYYEFGGTYHIKDFDQDSKTKMILYKKSLKGDRWAATVPLHAEVPCKVRKIYGARLGAIVWNSATDLSRALSKQHLTNADLKSTTNPALSLPPSYNVNGQTKSLNVFGNIHSADIYVGGSMTWIRNVAVSFDKYDDGVDDGIMTLFFDIMFAPSYKIDPVTYTDPTTLIKDTYSAAALKTNSFGFRAGIDGKFNRTLGWSYGGEFGYRPSITGMGFFAMFKIAFPLYSTNLDYKVESFGK
jgi:hypothetical protein